MSAAAESVDARAKEANRLHFLRELGILDTPPEPAYDEIVAFAARACQVPVALISLVDERRQWFKANLGLPGVDETAREVAFCDHAIRDGALMEVPDATRDPRFRDNPLVTDAPGIRFYAGAPITMPGGARVGTVCVIDRAPRHLDERQRATLESLAAIVGAMFTQRRQLQTVTDRLVDSEQRMRRMYEATPAILHSIGPDGRLLDVSDRWLALMGYERSEVVGRPSADFLTPQSQAHARDRVLPEFFRTGRCDRVEYQFVRKDGSTVDVLLSALLERDAEGAVVRSLAILEDVTATRQLQADLDRARAHLDAVLENMPALVGYWDRDGVTRFVNRDFQAAIGLPAEFILGHPLADVLRIVDVTGWRALEPRVQAVLGGRRQDFESALLTVAGLRQLRVTLVPAAPFEGVQDGFYGTWIDITGMKALELRLQHSERHYRLLFEHLSSGLALNTVELDAYGKPVDFRITSMNDAFARMLALDPDSAVGARITDLFPRIAADPADWIGRFGHVALTGETTQFEQLGDGGRWWHIVAYRSGPGQFALVFEDITARKQLEADLLAAHSHVRELERRLAGPAA